MSDQASPSSPSATPEYSLTIGTKQAQVKAGSEIELAILK
jgi:hypothetical protein